MIKQNSFSFRAQALVEMALLLMVILIIAMIVLDLGRAFYYYTVISNAAREGARYGIVNPTEPDGDVNLVGIESAVREKAVGIDQDILELDPLPDLNCIKYDLGGYCTLRTITVSTVYTFTPVTPIIGNFIGSGITLNASSTMRVER